MPVAAAFGAAAVGGAALQNLWYYNRENYMFDVPLRQSRDFQLQNLAISRFGLFREDVRDLANLTTGKMDSYLIVNTLKLGFIVTVYFNFDRTDGPSQPANYLEGTINLLFSMTFMTAFFFLVTSIWFSMHAVVLAQSFMTKMLVQTVRIPVPSADDVDQVVQFSGDYERNLGEALRLPFFSRRRKHQRARSEHNDPVRVASRSASKQQPDSQVVDEDLEAPAAVASTSSTSVGGVRRPTLPVWELLDMAVGDVSDGLLAVAASGAQEPHLKLFKLLMANWLPYDLYSKVSMEIGTATLLSGMAYYSVYYMRDTGAPFHVMPSGWCTFIFMSVLAWWSTILDLVLTKAEHAVLAVLVLGSPVLTMVSYALDRLHEVLPFIFLLQTIWVLMLCFGSLNVGDKWPRMWRAARFLNVQHADTGPPPRQADIARSQTNIARSWTPRRATTGLEQSRSLASETTTCQSFGSPTGQDPMSVGGACAAAGPLLELLDAALDPHGDIEPLPAHVASTVRRSRDDLFEATRAARVAVSSSVRAIGAVEGFWLTWPHNGDDHSHARWVSVGNVGLRQTAPTVPVGDLLEVVLKVVDELYSVSSTWTAHDMEKLTRYGGETVPGVQSFEAQFRDQGTSVRHGMGQTAKRFFTGGALIVSALWVLAVCFSFYVAPWRELSDRSVVISARRQAVEARSALLEAHGRLLPLELPAPWLAPAAIGCDADGQRVVLADRAGAFLVHYNGSGWHGPLTSCGSDEVVAADFGRSLDLWVASPAGIQASPLSTVAGVSRCARSVSHGLGPLDAMALDSLPSGEGREGREDHLDGLAVRRGQLVALQVDHSGGYRVLGTVNAPTGHRWAAVALRGRRGLAMDHNGTVFELDTVSGRWSRPMQLPGAFAWSGLCALPDSNTWLALGRRADGFGRPEFWHFTRPETPEL